MCVTDAFSSVQSESNLPENLHEVLHNSQGGGRKGWIEAFSRKFSVRFILKPGRYKISLDAGIQDILDECFLLINDKRGEHLERAIQLGFPKMKFVFFLTIGALATAQSTLQRCKEDNCLRGNIFNLIHCYIPPSGSLV